MVGGAEPCLPPWLLLLLLRLRLRLLLGLLLLRRQLRLPPAAAAAVLVVVHPHLEDLAPHADLLAELLHQRLVLLLHPPAQPLRERQHLLLLLRRELGPEPLPAQVPLRRGEVRGRRPALLAGGLGRGAAAAAGRAVVWERRRSVVGVGGGGGVGVGRRQEQRDARGRGRHRRRRREGRREQQLAPLAVVLAVEAPVAAAGGALERVVPGAGAGHELPAAVDDMPTQRRRVVAQALVVPHRRLGEHRVVPRYRSRGRGGRERRRGAGAHPLGGFLLAPKFHQRMPARPRRGGPDGPSP